MFAWVPKTWNVACIVGCQGKNKDIRGRDYMDLTKQKIWHWIKARWGYFLKNAWCKLGIKWTSNTKATTCIGEIEEDGAFKTCIYIWIS